MAAREIGTRMGTGGSRGVEYLRGTITRRYFPELWDVRLASDAPAAPGLRGRAAGILRDIGAAAFLAIPSAAGSPRGRAVAAASTPRPCPRAVPQPTAARPRPPRAAPGAVLREASGHVRACATRPCAGPRAPPRRAAWRPARRGSPAPRTARPSSARRCCARCRAARARRASPCARTSSGPRRAASRTRSSAISPARARTTSAWWRRRSGATTCRPREPEVIA